MRKAVGLFLFVVGASSYLAATATPEIDPAGAINAVALISGVLLIVRGRRRK